MWAELAFAAGCLQAARNGLAKSLSGRASPALISWARFAFNLPFSSLLVVVLAARGGLPAFPGDFLGMCAITALCQLLGNVALVAAFRRATFAASIVLHKLEVVFTALVGVWLFAEAPTALGWLGIAICGTGVLVMNLGATSGPEGLRRAFHFDAGALLSLLCGLLLVAASFALKEANELLRAANPQAGTGHFEAAAWTLFHTTWIEVAILSAFLLLRMPGELSHVRTMWPRMLAIGFTGFCGSLGWFWAYSLTLVAYVKAVGQVEAVLAVVLALVVWREREVVRQLPGVALTIGGIVLVLLG